MTLDGFSTGTDLDTEYQITRIVGHGAFSMVYEAERKTDGELFAIREVDCSKIKTDEKETLTREMSIIPHLSHPSLVKYIKYVENAGTKKIYSVMEYCEKDLGKFVHEYTEQGNRIPEGTVWRFLAQVASGLAYLHAPYGKMIPRTELGGDAKQYSVEEEEVDMGRIIHRDLKPDNILLTDDENFKICDFGLSRTIENELLTSKLGTPIYMAPEVLAGEGYTQAADLWALGCIAYEMCQLEFFVNVEPNTNSKGAQIYPPDRIKDFIDKKRGETEDEGSLCPEIKDNYSPELAEVISNLLTCDPILRYSAFELLEHPKIKEILKELRK